MNVAMLTTVDGLADQDANAIVRRLTRRGSEFQAEVGTVLEGRGSSCTPVAVWNADGAVVSWACSHVWEGKQTLEMYTDERHRNTGKATTLAAMLLGAGVLDRREPVAVFSLEAQSIAAKLGMVTLRYERHDGGWRLA
jgi:hypothetical protein